VIYTAKIQILICCKTEVGLRAGDHDVGEAGDHEIAVEFVSAWNCGCI
jgi:hypothetical protein